MLNNMGRLKVGTMQTSNKSATLISNKVHFRAKRKVMKEEQHITIKRSTHAEDKRSWMCTYQTTALQNNKVKTGRLKMCWKPCFGTADILPNNHLLVFTTTTILLKLTPRRRKTRQVWRRHFQPSTGERASYIGSPAILDVPVRKTSSMVPQTGDQGLVYGAYDERLLSKWTRSQFRSHST